MSEDIERTAYHEAGHVVMCHLVGGRQIIDVITMSSENKLGVIHYEPRHWVSDHERDEIMNPEIWVELVKDAMIGYAGEHAQRLKFGDAEGTLDTNRDYLVFLLIICTTQEREQIIQNVDNLLQDNWAKVETVAEALLMRTTLSGQEVLEMIGD